VGGNDPRNYSRRRTGRDTPYPADLTLTHELGLIHYVKGYKKYINYIDSDYPKLKIMYATKRRRANEKYRVKNMGKMQSINENYYHSHKDYVEREREDLKNDTFEEKGV
jgi:hypothetical protein